jgi:TIR domain
MALDLQQLKRHAREYVEIEGRTTVLGIRFVRRYTLFGREDVVLRVRTTDKSHPNWWVIGGSTPMNLYSTKDYPDPDVAYSLHHGILLRMADRNYEESSRAPAEIGYDAFIAHATEDKRGVAKPLAIRLRNMGYRVWYDEFELRVGDSLRRSIDRGLANSRFGIVVLSPAFFSKNWPQYELNGLTTREMDGESVILPIWHRVDAEDVRGYSPALADKIGLITKKMSIEKIAQSIRDVFERDE